MFLATADQYSSFETLHRQPGRFFPISAICLVWSSESSRCWRSLWASAARLGQALASMNLSSTWFLIWYLDPILLWFADFDAWTLNFWMVYHYWIEWSLFLPILATELQPAISWAHQPLAIRRSGLEAGDPEKVFGAVVWFSAVSAGFVLWVHFYSCSMPACGRTEEPVVAFISNQDFVVVDLAEPYSRCRGARFLYWRTKVWFYRRMSAGTVSDSIFSRLNCYCSALAVGTPWAATSATIGAASPSAGDFVNSPVVFWDC